MPRLDKYRSMRKAGATPEPFGPEGDGTQAGTRLFVVQKHAATRMHYDFRLEWNGVLVSWAVPKGPSFDPKEKRYAVQTEDHPIAYADFEGVIPDGNYGAGEVIVWDRGRWTPLEDFDEGMKKGKLLFELHGFKLRGVWTLVRLKDTPKDWLLIKHKDTFAGDAEPADTSILSGLTVEDLRDRGARATAWRRELERIGAVERPVRASEVELMLAEHGDRPFSRAGWLFEIKYDGFRLLAGREDGKAHLYYRRGAESTALFPDVAQAVAALPVDSIVLDGEVVVHDEHNRPSFQRLQKRTQLTRASDIARAAVEHPAVLYVFDLLALDGWDLRALPLVERKRLLKDVLPQAGPLRYADHIETRGEDMYAAAAELGLEGVVGKRADAPYRGGRSSDWVKLRRERSADFAIVGYTEPKRGRVGIGALHLAVLDGKTWRYAGRVGTGLTDRQLRDTRVLLDAKRRARPIFEGRGPLEKSGHTWCEPTLVCEVGYREWTEEALLRLPVFLRFRDDKRPEDCQAPSVHEPALTTAAREEPSVPRVEPATRVVPFSNLDKIFWPDEKYTKGDLIAYYRAISLWLLRYLRDRPVVLTRYPDGIRGKSFFQKDAPGFVPEWLRTERMWSEQTQREIDHFVCDTEEALLYLVNLGTIPLHVWGSRAATLERPDWCILDLDPKGAPFAHVVELALAVRDLCDEIGLPSYPKTSGSTGLHVLVPLGRMFTFDQCTMLGGLLARVLVQRLPEIATVERVIGKRGGRVYLDYLQNGHGKLLVAPFSVRPVEGARVSTPLDWSEVGKKLDPAKFTIRSVPRRMARRKIDPMAAVIDEQPDLQTILSRLAERV
jgi:bifunctional non-homologous end joining protein LigD